MLQSLHISNFVLIAQLDIQFDKGFSVITGETGAGKSIILGALSLVLGQRADAGSIQQGSDRCVMEAVFDVRDYQLRSFFEDHDLEYDPESCIMRRELYSNGKSRAFVNDSPVPLSVMKDLGMQLIDIHSQNQNQKLGDPAFQLNVIDVLADDVKELSEYKTAYQDFCRLKQSLKSLEEKAAHSREEEDYDRFQWKQLDEVQLQSGEQTDLEKEQETLSHAEEIKTSLYKITELLQGDEQSALPFIKEALSVTESLQPFYPKAKEYAERLRSSFIDLSDLSSEVDGLKEDVEYNPERMNWINQRLDTLYSLEQKHHVSTEEELIAVRDRFKEKLDGIESFDMQIEEMRKTLDTSYTELVKKASAISALRKKAASTFSKELEKLAAPLGIPNIRFKASLTQLSAAGESGIDRIDFLFSANKNADLQPVSQTASGGEVSRLMLCIKAMIAGFTALPTIVFDEVDTGVSSDIADKMANIMSELGKRMQVLTITHLPQIAAKGKEHFMVYKKDTAERTETHIRKLDPEERIQEIAHMLSGATVTKASFDNAKELLNVRTKTFD